VNKLNNLNVNHLEIPEKYRRPHMTPGPYVTPVTRGPFVTPIARGRLWSI